MIAALTCRQITGEAVRTAVDKLIRAGLLEEVRANGSLLAWRRDVEAGPSFTSPSRASKRSGSRMRRWALLRTQALARLPPTKSMPYGQKIKTVEKR